MPDLDPERDHEIVPIGEIPVEEPERPGLDPLDLKKRHFGHVDDNVPATALVLSGGGSKGSFEVGALDYLTRSDIWKKINLRYVCGTSVGAIMALKIAESGYKGVKDLVSLFLSLQSENDMYLPHKNIGEILQILDDLNVDIDQVIETGGVNGGEPELPGVGAGFVLLNILSFGTLAVGVIEDLTDMLGKILKVINLFFSAPSLYTLKPIEELIKAKVDFNKFGTSLTPYIKMRLATVCLEDAQTWYVTEDARLIKGNANTPEVSWQLDAENGMGTIKDALVQGTIASSSIPCIYEAKDLRADPYKDGHFVDGGVRDVLPIRAALELGAERVISILAGPEEPLREPAGSYHNSNMVKILYRLMDTQSAEITANEIKPEFGKWPADVENIPIFSEMHVHNSMEVNPGLININMAYGYMRAYEQTLKKLLNVDLELNIAVSLYVNTMAIIELRKQIWSIEHNLYENCPFLVVRKVSDPDDMVGGDQAVGEYAVVFNKPTLDILRVKKKELLELVEERMQLFEYNDPHCLPMKFEGIYGPEITLKLTDWWDTWERHGNGLVWTEKVWKLWAEKGIDAYGPYELRRIDVGASGMQFDSFLARHNLWERCPISIANEQQVFEAQDPDKPSPSTALLQVLNP